jgi:hypothetical protein
MTRFLLAALTALLLVSCGGGGSADPGQMAVAGEEPLKAKILVPDPTLFAEPVSTVNTTTAGNQELRSLGATTDGGYTVAWISGTAILYVQRYDSLGAKVGIETQIPIVVEDAVGQAIQFSVVSVLGDGNVVVVYRAISNTTLPVGTISTKQGLYFQIFTPEGVLLKGQTEIASIEEVIHSRSPSLTDQQNVALTDGGFVVGWTVRSFSAQFGYQANLSLQRYDSQGQPVGGVIQVGQFPALTYSITADALGGFTLHLTQMDASFSSLVSIIHYDANSTAHQIVPPMTGAALLLPVEGGYVLITSDATGATRQLLDSAGSPIGDPTTIASMPVAARALSDGTYVLFWASGTSFTAQRYAADGTAMGDLLVIQNSGNPPQIAALADVGFALAWTGAGASGDTDVFTQRFIEVLTARKRACLNSAKGLRGQERKAYMVACLA